MFKYDYNKSFPGRVSLSMVIRIHIVLQLFRRERKSGRASADSNVTCVTGQIVRTNRPPRGGWPRRTEDPPIYRTKLSERQVRIKRCVIKLNLKNIISYYTFILKIKFSRLKHKTLIVIE